MADRIERYLGRLEAELENRVEPAELEAMLLEVEGHLRESEDAYVELGEPEALANRLAVEGFGGVEIVTLECSPELPVWRRHFEIVAGLLFVWLQLECLILHYYSVGTEQYGEIMPLLYTAFVPLIILSGIAGRRRWLAGGAAISVFLLMTLGEALLENVDVSGRMRYPLVQEWDLALVSFFYIFAPIVLCVVLTKYGTSRGKGFNHRNRVSHGISK